MGQHQLDEFLCNVPAAIRPLIQERKINMSFRFGNNSIVPCHRAILVPVDRFLIKIAIVGSKTPFLISNSVCRNLGAVIDTTKQTIFFRELQCTLPLTLSGKNLFLMDFCELLEKKPPRQTETDCQKKQPAETVLNCHAAESDSTDPKSFQEPQASDLPAQMFFPDHVTDQSVLISSDTSVHLQLPSQPSDHHVKCPVQPEFDRTFRCHPELREKDQLKQMQLPQLSEMTIAFGQTKLGHGEVINTDPRYCRWFLGKYGDSKKMEHRTFVRFLNLWIDQKELEQEQPTQPSAKAVAKGRPSPDHGRRSPPSPTLDPIDLDDEETWDEIQMSRSEKHAEEVNAHRLDQVEEVLNHVLTQLQLLTNRSSEA